MRSCPNCGFPNAEEARFCSNCGTALEPARSIEGERRFATVLFADVAKSTSIAEKLDPEDWALIINGAFGFMNATVSRYEGTVARLMGDAVLALFGAPVAHEDDAERAVRAGLEIQEKAVEYARAVKAKYNVDFGLRVGINTGTSVLAFVGDATKTEYTALGDVANVAARLQSAAEPGTVLISADTERLVHALFEFKPRGLLEMKGKEAGVQGFEVLRAKAVPGSMRGIEGLASPLVGRDDQFKLLRDKLADLGRGVGSVVAVLGEAGIGKSRLIAELRHVREQLPEPRPLWLEGHGISYGQSIPYFPWRQLGRQLVGATEMDSAGDVRQKLADFIERLRLPERDLPFLETMLAVDSEDSRRTIATLAGDAVVNGVANAVVDAVKAASRADLGETSCILVIDDLHWSDSASLELLAQVATLAAFEPLLILCILRPDRRAPSWALVDRLQVSLGSSFTRIDLEPLDGSASSELLGNLLRIEDLPETIRQQILQRSEGNPFYLEEVLRSLIDGGQVVREGEHWRATRDILEARIPENLAGVLSARIDRLPEVTKRVAQTASVIGRVFQHRVLEAVCRSAPEEERVVHVEPHLATLSYEQLVRERAREPEREYIFKHALTCEAAYGLLLRSRRRDLHARCGAALELLFAERRDEFAPMLAHHFAQAEDLPRTLEYSRLAATNARRLFALREELDHRERILATLDKLPQEPPASRIDAILDWAFVRHRLNSYDQVLDRLGQAETLGRDIGDKVRLGLTLSWTANMHIVTGYPSRAVPYLMETQQLASETGNDQLVILPLYFATLTLVDRDPGKALGQLDEVIDLARRNNVPEVFGHALAYRAVSLARIGEFERARVQIEEALELAPHAGSPVLEADIYIAAGAVYLDLGEVDKSLELARKGAELAYQANGLECACSGYYQVGQAELAKREADAALVEFDKSLAFARQSGYTGFLNLIQGGQARAEFEKGNDAAIDRLRQSVESAQSINDTYSATVLAMQLVDALVRRNRLDEAAPFLEYAMTYYREKGLRPYLARALELAARLDDKAGRPDEAEKARKEAESLVAPLLVSASDPVGSSPAL